jgi:hypothetical protein
MAQPERQVVQDRGDVWEGVEGAEMVSQVMLTFDTLRSESLPRGVSRDLIMKVAEETWT